MDGAAAIGLAMPPRRIAVLAFSPLARDARVMRTVQALAARGHAVTALGHGAPPEDLPAGADYIALPMPGGGLAGRVKLALGAAPARLLPPLALAAHDLRAHHRAARRALVALRPEIVHANDWPALPAALAARAACGARIVYDSHEYAVEEHAGRALWRLLLRPHVAAVEARGIRAASRVLAVSPGIAAALARRHGLAAPPAVLRNLPPYQAMPLRPPGPGLRLLFHGLLLPGRGIETAIAALALLPADHGLTLRGDGAPAYLDALRARARAAGVAARVAIEPAVLRAEVVPRANRDADIGLLLLPDGGAQQRHALPNKLFEYAMAGLAVLATPGEDRAALMGAHGFGRLVPPGDPAALAAVLRALTADQIVAMKAAALAAARRLNWDAEREILWGAYAGL